MAMLNQNTTIKGIHNGVQLVAKEDGTEMYHSTKTGKCAMNFRGVARMLDCDPKTISNQAVKLGLGKELEMYTTNGIQPVKLIMEDELNDLLEAIRDSKCKKETKQRAKEVQGKCVQAGFRLQVLLEVAPEVVAKEAIDNIKDPDKALKIAEDAYNHGKYLQSHIAINHTTKRNGLKPGKVVGENNLAVNLPYKGGRNKADTRTKITLTGMQLDQAGILDKIHHADKKYEDSVQYKILDGIRQKHAILQSEMQALIDSID